jgi:5-formyltetrahydrofolate cyclo-ligase
MMIMSKHPIRQHMRHLREQLSPEQVQVASEQVISHLLAHPHFIQSQHIALYRAIYNEVDPSGLLSDPRCQDKTLYLPCITPDRSLHFVRVDANTTYQRNHYGIEEPLDKAPHIAPQDLDMALIPTLALNAEGYRIGYGGGYYDRTFQHNRPYLLALIYDFQRHAVFTPAPHDLRCDDNICLAVETK